MTSSAEEELLYERFAKEADEKGPGGRHARLQKFFTTRIKDWYLRIAGAIPLFQGIKLRKNLFAYGTLTDEDFVEKLCGRKVEMLDAKLEGYAKEKAGPYYIAAKLDGSAIEGKLLLDLTSDELKMLDFWEEYGISSRNSVHFT